MGMEVIEEKCRHDEATSMSAAAIVNALTDQAKRKKKKKKKEEGSNGNSLVDKESEITPSVAPSSDAHSANVPDATGEPEPAVDETTSSKKKKKKKKRQEEEAPPNAAAIAKSNDATFFAEIFRDEGLDSPSRESNQENDPPEKSNPSQADIKKVS